MVRAQPVDLVLENLTGYFLKARWLQMLLADGRNPDTNATIIPPAVLDTLATGFSVWAGNSCVLCIIFLLPLFTEQECMHTACSDSGQFPDAPELSPATYSGGQSQMAYRGHCMCLSFRPLGCVYSTLAGYSDA